MAHPSSAAARLLCCRNNNLPRAPGLEAAASAAPAARPDLPPEPVAALRGPRRPPILTRPVRGSISSRPKSPFRRRRSAHCRRMKKTAPITHPTVAAAKLVTKEM
jgi:hypothetical protein